jgi:hypothetical protein
MSTRCTTHFVFGQEAGAHSEAIVYRHSDGYPDCMLPALAQFFEAVEQQTKDTRFTDPSYLAAKFVVWLAGEFAYGHHALDFLSVGVVTEDPDDIKYRYVVHCDQKDEDGRPVVTVDEL